jgi:hypothetical protein
MHNLLPMKRSVAGSQSNMIFGQGWETENSFPPTGLPGHFSDLKKQT